MSTSRENHVVIFALILIAATLAFYAPVTRNGFIAFDDPVYVTDNLQVQQGLTWKSVKWAFTTLHAGFWQPLTWLSYELDCQLFHLNPIGHHYTSLLLHTSNALLLLFLLFNATGRLFPSVLVAALFALHPVNVQSVVWAAERKNVLSTLFFLLALHAYHRYARAGRRLDYFAVLLLFALGLMAKAQIVTLPFVLLLWDYWPLQRIDAKSLDRDSGQPRTHRTMSALVLEKLPHFFLAAAGSYMAVMGQRAGNAVRSMGEVPLAVRLEEAVVSYARYLEMAFWPSRLAGIYPRSATLLPILQVAEAAILLVLISLLVLLARRRRFLAFGWLWFLGTLVPMLGIVSVGEEAMADRFAYIPFIGLFVAVVWGLDTLTARYRVPAAWKVATATCLVFVLGSCTYRQIGYWHDDETLWRYTLSVTDGNYMAHSNLAYALAHAGRPNEAIEHFRAARALHRYSADQIVKLAHYELRTGHPREALDEGRAALDASPDPPARQAALREMGRAFLELRQFDDADRSYREALRLAPDDTDALLNSGLLALRAGNTALAVEHFSHAADLEPNDVNFLLLAQALAHNGQADAARRATEQARRISANFAESQRAVAQFLALAQINPL